MKLRGLSRFVDILASIIGVLSICYFLLNPKLDWWVWDVNPDLVVSGVAGGLGALYLFGAIFQWAFNRIKFDRTLARGRYLVKVIAMVALMPSMITATLWLNEKHDIIDFSEWNIVPEESATEEGISIPDIFVNVYYNYMDPGQQAEVEEAGTDRFFVALFAILGVLLLNGLMVSTIVGWVDGRKEMWNRGVIHYGIHHLGRRRFSVIIGANEIAALAIKRLFQNRGIWWGRNKYVLLHTSRDPEAVREELMSHLSEDQMRRVVIYQGLRDSRSEIEHLHLKWANELYILGETTQVDGSDSSHDTMNMRSVNLVAEYLLKNRWNGIFGKYHKLKCSVMFEYQTTYQMLQFADIPKSVKETMDFVPFNRYESWARKVMVEGAAHNNLADVNSADESIRYTPLDGCEGIATESDDHVHLVIVGMTKMGVAMGVQALLQAHYLNYAHSEMCGDVAKMSSRRTRITFIDANASQQMNFFKGRYENLFSLVRHRIVSKYILPDVDSGWNDPIMDDDKMNHLLGGQKHNFLDVEVDFVEGGLEDGSIRDYLCELCDSRGSEWVRSAKLTIAVCHEDTSEALASALYMPVEVYEKVQQVWVYQRESADIILNFKSAKGSDGRYSKLRPFGMLYGGYIDDEAYTKKAILVNSAYSVVANSQQQNQPKEDFSEYKKQWDGLSMRDKFSNYYFVDSIPQKLRAVRAQLNVHSIKKSFGQYAGALARLEHNRWMVQQLILGFSACDADAVADIKGALIEKKLALGELERIKADLDEESYKTRKKSIDNKFKVVVNGYRNSIRHQHQCICAYDNIDNVDMGAKAYDTMLNNAIAAILRRVDGIAEE
jgi:hypothetical protein